MEMIKINNKKLESQVKEILQRTSFASANEYLAARIGKDYKAVVSGKSMT